MDRPKDTERQAFRGREGRKETGGQQRREGGQKKFYFYSFG